MCVARRSAARARATCADAARAFAQAPLRRTALVQVASADACLLAHVHALPRLPPGLAALLEDPAVLKVGTGVVADLDKLAVDFVGLRPASFVDLAVIAKLFRYERTGMKSMSAAFGAEVVKSKQTQLSNWEDAPLSTHQIAYAAEDAALGLWLLDKLHATHGGGAALRDWVAVFLNAPSPDALASRPAASLGPLRKAVAAYTAAAAAAEAAMRAQKLDKRQQAALQAGLANAAVAVSALTNLAAARGQTLSWTDVVRNIKGRAVVESACRMGGERLAHARGNSRTAARREAAFAALQRLANAAAAAQGDDDNDAENLVP